MIAGYEHSIILYQVLRMRSKKILMLGLLIAGILFLALNPLPVFAGQLPQKNIAIYFFWGDGCPHCAQAEPFLKDLAQKNPGVEIKSYEVWHNPENRELFTQMAAKFGFEPSGVPTIFAANDYWVGFSDEIAGQIETVVTDCLQESCPDAGEGVIPGRVDNGQTPNVTKTPDPSAFEKPFGNLKDEITLPLIGKISLNNQSLTLSTLLISFVDGVNPCSIWVLSILMALTLHTGSRRKVIIIGLIFLTVTAGIYALFIAGLFTIFSFVNYIGWIQIVVSLMALFFAVINIKDYFWYKEGLSFTIADDKKPGIFQRIRKVMDASQSFWGLASATVVMAAGVSLVEFSCTAGFPVLWTNLLAAQKVTSLTFILLLALYMFIYQLDEMVIFFTAVFTLKASKLEEKQGRILKLIGGMLMLALSVVMLVNPALMNSLLSSVVIFGVAFGATLLVLLVHRKILPSFGIWIGTEANTHKQNKKRKSKSSL
jgi:thiol-disulfide isomerase/thioredoxin